MTEDEQIPAPERIWIEDEFGFGHEDQWAYGCWNERDIDGPRDHGKYDVEYVRADLAAAKDEEIARLKDIVKTQYGMLEAYSREVARLREGTP